MTSHQNVNRPVTSATPLSPPTVDVDLPDALIEEDLLVEEVSIDGMCGVY